MPILLNKFINKLTTPVAFGKPKSYQLKRYFKIFINLNYIAGFIYAFQFYIRSPRSTHMAERRLWALESWTILTFYGFFIYLFYLEKSAVENQPGLYRFTQIKAQSSIDSSAKKIQEWLESLEKDPKKYKFDSHQGVQVESGMLSEPGSIFSTQEIFAGIKLNFQFKVLEASNNRFEFKLIQPKWLAGFGIKGKFELVPVSTEQTILKLIIFNKPPDYFIGAIAILFLYLSPIRLLIAKQINKEVDFTKQSIE